MLIFAARRKSRARRCPIFSALWIECFTSQLPHLVIVFFSRCWNKKLASGHRYNARRPLFRFSWPPRRPLDGHRTWSLRTTNTALLETNRDDLASAEQIDTLHCTYDLRTTVSCFPTRGWSTLYIVYSLLILRVALNILFTFTLKRVWFERIFVAMINSNVVKLNFKITPLVYFCISVHVY